MKTIQYFTKSVYGRDLEYVVDRQVAQFIANLTGSKTLKPQDRANIEGLTGGAVKFEQVLQPK